jgi:hypothetical protein
MELLNNKGLILKLSKNKNKKKLASNKPVLDGAKLSCNQGTQHSSLTVTSHSNIFIEDKLQGTIQDSIPGRNISPFGDCKLRPTKDGFEPCSGYIGTADWEGEIKNSVGPAPPLLESFVCKCTIGGIIKIEDGLSRKTKHD